jgi:oligopeptide transport system ATP-binding protein
MTTISSPVLELDDVTKHFPARGRLFDRDAGAVRAVDGVSLAVGQGETVGLVGETGCGKSTLAQLIVRLLPPTSGTIRYQGQDVSRLRGGALQAFRKDVQLIFQDPSASLDPRMRVRDIIAEPLRAHRLTRDIRGRVGELLEIVGLRPEDGERFPHQFSGGQRQRVGIARAVAMRPRLIVCDEPVSALDVSVQAQILNLLKSLQREFQLSYLFISHDLSVVRHVSDRVAVMYLGRVAETAARDDLFLRPRHPYTGALLSAVPLPDPRRERARRRIVLGGDLPSPSAPPAGCRFHPRCPRRQPECTTAVPELLPQEVESHLAACHFPVRDGEPVATETPSPK